MTYWTDILFACRGDAFYLSNKFVIEGKVLVFNTSIRVLMWGFKVLTRQRLRGKMWHKLHNVINDYYIVYTSNDTNCIVS